MTDEERNEEGAEEKIEDLEAPADAQGDVAAGYGPGICSLPTTPEKATTCTTTGGCYTKKHCGNTFDSARS